MLMTRLPWALLGILPLGVTLACGSGEDRPKDGTGGKPDSGAGGASGDGGRSSGGSENTGGTSEDAGRVDTQAPTFNGAEGVDVTGPEDRVRVTWTAATDDVTPEKRIAYRIYRASESDGQDFTRQRRCAEPAPELPPIDAARLPCFVTSGAGATSALVRDVIPAHPYFFVVRAVDEAGNEDTNVNQVSAQTDDATGPEFGGVRSVSVASATSLKVAWGPGYDLASSDAELKFKVYAAAGKDPDPTKDAAVHESGPGEHEAIVTGLEPLTAYRVLVRAVDPTGNEDANTRILGATTPEGLPPTFDGVSHALEQGIEGGKGRARVFWAPATDNVTDSANILYDVYQATRTRGQRFDRPTYTSQPGASSILITGLELGTRYYYVVRARDVGGNQDGNIREISVVTRTIDQTVPAFSGISTAAAATPTAVTLTWSPANDAVTTKPAGFTYLIYVSETSPVDTEGAPHIAVSGATTITVGGLKPATTYHFVARARDQAGNLTAATAERTATTPAADAGDTTAPDFSAANLQVARPAGTDPTVMNLSWTAATDASGAANVRYHVCASMIQSDCEGTDFFRHVVLTTGFGAVSAAAGFLVPRTDYHFFVRAEDRAGNVSASPPFVRLASATSFVLNVLPILAARCSACHDFREVSSIVNRTSQINWACPTGDPFKGCPLDLIEPGQPEFSAIYRKINPPNLRTSPFSASVPNEYGGLQEPRDTLDKLTGAEDDAIRTWIQQGALAN